MKTYSMDFREGVVRAYDQNVGSQKKIASLFGVSISWVKKILRRRRETGSIAPKPHGGGHPPAFDSSKQKELKALLKREPDATLEELRAKTGVECSLVAVWLTLKRMGCRRKKSPSTRQSRTGRM